MSPKLDLNLFDHFLHKLGLFPFFFISSTRLKALSNSLNFASAVEPIYLYIKSSGLTLFFNSVIHLNLLSTSLLNISLCFKINRLSFTS